MPTNKPKTPKTPRTPRAKKPKVNKVVVAPNLPYKTTLKLNGKEYQAEGETLLQAISKLNPEHYKTKGTLRVEFEGKKVERFLFIPQMRKLFAGGESLTAKIARESTVKFINMMLK